MPAESSEESSALGAEQPPEAISRRERSTWRLRLGWLTLLVGTIVTGSVLLPAVPHEVQLVMSPTVTRSEVGARNPAERRAHVLSYRVERDGVTLLGGEASFGPGAVRPLTRSVRLPTGAYELRTETVRAGGIQTVRTPFRVAGAETVHALFEAP